MNAQWILSWWNLIYIIPAGLALLYLGVYILSGWTFGEADVDVDTDFDADADVDVDSDIDVDHDVGLEHDADTDADASHEAAGGSGVWSALSFLGVGRVPVSIVLMVLLLTWGICGFAVNRIAALHVAEPWQVAMFSLPLAAILSLLVTSSISSAIDRFMPLNVSLAKRRHELLGASGEVILPVDAKFGMVSVRDADSGDLYQVPCRLQAGTDAIPKGARAKLVGYNARESLFYVLPDATGNRNN